MFGKSKQVPPAVETHYGWTDGQLERLEKTLASSRPSFHISLVGFAQQYGRNVYDPLKPFSESELFGAVETFKAIAEGRIDIEPIGTVGHISFTSRGTDDEGYKPRVNFQLAVSDAAEEARLQAQLHAAFAAKINPSLAVFLDPVAEAAERISEIREDGGCDAIPLRSFRLVTEFGRVDI